MSQLDKLDIYAARRKEIVSMYDDDFAEMPELILQQEIPAADTVRHLYILQLDEERLRANRREFFDALAAEGIIPNAHYIPVYYHPYYQKLGCKKGPCPNAEHLYERMLSILL